MSRPTNIAQSSLGTFRAWPILAALLVISGGIHLSLREGSGRQRRAEQEGGTTSLPDRSAIAESSASRGLLGTDGVLAWREPNSSQRFTGKNFAALEVTDYTRDPQTGAWDSRTHFKSATYSIMRVSSARKDLYAIAGLARDGDFVLESWQLIAGIVPPGGNPQLPPKAFSIERIYKGRLGTGVIAMDYDPEGRFMLTLLRDGEDSVLYKFNSQAGSPAVELYHSSNFPEWATMGRVWRFDHTHLGRVWQFSEWKFGGDQIWLVDSDNNGSFDGSPIVGTYEFFEVSGLSDIDDIDELLGLF